MNVLIIGATSAIAEATARIYAEQGARLHLIARNAQRLDTLCKHLAIASEVEVTRQVLDVNDVDRHEQVCDAAFDALGDVDVVLIAHGTLPDQAACQQSAAKTRHELSTNAVSTISLLTIVAERLAAQGHGTIAVVSSVAGDRGRQSNYVYGSAKAAVTVFLQGLRNRLHKVGVEVVTIKPGFVDTPMTASFDKGALWAKPEQVAAGIVRAVRRGKSTAYLPFFWRPIMLVIRSIPESVFKRLSL